MCFYVQSEDPRFSEFWPANENEAIKYLFIFQGMNLNRDDKCGKTVSVLWILQHFYFYFFNVCLIKCLYDFFSAIKNDFFSSQPQTFLFQSDFRSLLMFHAELLCNWNSCDRNSVHLKIHSLEIIFFYLAMAQYISQRDKLC